MLKHSEVSRRRPRLTCGDAWPGASRADRLGMLLEGVRRDLHGVVVLVRGDDEVASWALAGPLGLEVVDDLARLQLAVRRAGFRIRLRQVSPGLSGLLDLVGLGDVLPEDPLREAEGEPEGGEQAGVEEVVVPNDPLA